MTDTLEDIGWAINQFVAIRLSTQDHTTIAACNVAEKRLEVTFQDLLDKQNKELLMKNLERDAMTFARRHHTACGHLRKYTKLPYIVHPGAVVSLVKTVSHTPQMVAAAWLHDTVEDCPNVTLELIGYHFGSGVEELVEMLTDVSVPSDGNRAARKRIDREHSAKASPEGQTVKVADLIDNSSSIIRYDSDFAAVFVREMAATLDVLTEADPALINLAHMIIRRYYNDQ